MKKSCGFLESFSMHAKRAEGQRISEWLKSMETFSFHNCIQTIELTTTIKEFQTRERVTLCIIGENQTRKIKTLPDTNNQSMNHSGSAYLTVFNNGFHLFRNNEPSERLLHQVVQSGQAFDQLG